MTHATMERPGLRRRLGKMTAVVGVTAASVLIGIAPATASPTTDAADWLETQLVTGDHFEEFSSVSPGLTADGVLAFEAAGYSATADDLAGWLEDTGNIGGDLGGGYVGDTTDFYPGALAKVSVAALASGGDPTSWDGIDLIDRLEDTLVTAGTDVGRFADPRDNPTYFGYANPTSQALALIAIKHEDPTFAGLPDAAEYLRDQACVDGGFSFEFTTTQCTDSDPDSTAVVVQALTYVGGLDNNDVAALANEWLVDAAESQADGIAWLNICQDPYTTDEPSVNSTGLAIGGLLSDPSGPGTYAPEVADGQTWLEAAQNGDGGQPACTDTGASDVRATVQGALGLAGVSYLDLI